MLQAHDRHPARALGEDALRLGQQLQLGHGVVDVGLGDFGPDDLLALLDGLDQVASTTRPADRRRLGELQLQAAESLDAQRNSLDPANRQRLDRCLAQAFVAAGVRHQKHENDVVVERPLLTIFCIFNDVFAFARLSGTRTTRSKPSEASSQGIF